MESHSIVNGGPTWQQLLAEREHRALLMTTRARLFASAIGLLALMQTAAPGAEAVRSSSLVGGYLLCAVAMLLMLRDPRRSHAVGVAGAVLDSALIVMFPIIWHSVHTSPDRPMIHLMGHQLTPLTFFTILINCGALRALYPAIVTAVGTAVHLSLAYLAVTDPRLENYPGGLTAIISVSGRGEADLFITGQMILIGGVGLVLLTRSVRKLLGEVVEGELRQYEIREAQMQLMMETRISALAQLVAGVVHEVNSPLGAMQSAADTASRALAKLRERVSDGEDRGAARTVEALEGSLKLTRDAGERLSEVMSAIKGFSHLDRGDRQDLDMSQILRDVVEVQQSSLGEGVRWELDLTQGATVQGDGGRLSHAMSTLIENAAEAVDGDGTVSVSSTTEGDRVRVRIQDDGKGIADDQLEALFDVELDAAGRVKARFGLPTCRSVIHGHGGEIQVESEVARGTIFTILLPAAAAEGRHVQEGAAS